MTFLEEEIIDIEHNSENGIQSLKSANVERFKHAEVLFNKGREIYRLSFQPPVI